ncbi:hypothetical protein GXP67_28995 [Rhodocytophaga rosea]|uniref:NTF2 fold domain-containing protein n=1 Tax=Rhodocytophaga rosea TaxID=2704465 RepID=A0A6C0GQP5_9BACT|nr:NTF2 fold immunity protein [Rhodocytophaga rosea]QHT70405.1 hypothetical protein GXP67_28995 [Rhodocytophaga rosea]
MRENTSYKITSQISEDSTYAKEFIKRSLETKGLLLAGMKPIIKDKQAAIAVAEAILFPIYGEENILKQRPYQVYKTELYWVITGTLPEGYKGGVFEIAIDATDARVIGLTHGK